MLSHERQIPQTAARRMCGVPPEAHHCLLVQFALQAQGMWLGITSRQIEAGRRAMTRYGSSGGGKIWNSDLTPTNGHHGRGRNRMGSGKGNPEFWVGCDSTRCIFLRWWDLRSPKHRQASDASAQLQAAGQNQVWPSRNATELGVIFPGPSPFSDAFPLESS